MKDNRPRMSIKELKGKAATYERAGLSLIIWGATGIGKTDIMFELAEQTDRELRIFYPAGMEPTDLSGLPEFKEDKNLVVFHQTDITHFEKDKKYLLFIDELNRAPVDVQQALLGLWNHKKYIGSHPIEADVWVVTCMNDAELQSNVILQQTDDAFRTRGGQVVLEPSLPEVAAFLKNKYGTDNLGARFVGSPQIKEAIDKNFDNIYNAKETGFIMATPRNLEMLCKVAEGLDNEQVRDVLPVVRSIVGTEVAGSFVAFLKNLKRIEPKALFTKTAAILKKLKDITAVVDQKNGDVLLNAFQSAVSIAGDQEDAAIRIFLQNLHILDGNYKEVKAAVYSNIRTGKERKLMRALADKKFMKEFLVFHRKSDKKEVGEVANESKQ